jgi:hypothetical protein
MSIKRANDEHDCWVVRTMYHYLPRLPDEARRDLTPPLFTSWAEARPGCHSWPAGAPVYIESPCPTHSI